MKSIIFCNVKLQCFPMQSNLVFRASCACQNLSYINNTDKTQQTLPSTRQYIHLHTRITISPSFSACMLHVTNVLSTETLNIYKQYNNRRNSLGNVAVPHENDQFTFYTEHIASATILQKNVQITYCVCDEIMYMTVRFPNSSILLSLIQKNGRHIGVKWHAPFIKIDNTRVIRQLRIKSVYQIETPTKTLRQYHT